MANSANNWSCGLVPKMADRVDYVDLPDDHDWNEPTYWDDEPEEPE